MEVLWIVLGLILLLVLVVVGRAFLLKPTSAQSAKIALDQSERADKYGKQLSTLIQKETISSRFDADRTKFLEFHEILAEMFPNVHPVENCRV